MNSDCVFCKIVSRAIPAPLLYEDEQVVAFRDISPQAPAHLLVIPKQHFVDLPSLIVAGEEALAGRLLKVATQVAREQGLVESGFRTVINTGEHGGQSVFHLHVHVLGGRHLAWPPG
ncbi:MAG TPA: histidine triad nucleotide-binding protein [Pseudomonadota bacterium]|nr:histidine triad nucleotide-binding protein [Pseudomonadota bacterium]